MTITPSLSINSENTVTPSLSKPAQTAQTAQPASTSSSSPSDLVEKIMSGPSIAETLIEKAKNLFHQL